MFTFGLAAHGYSKYFNKAWEHTALAWIEIVLKVAADGYAGYGMMTKCLLQHNYSERIPWVEEFMVKGPVSGHQTPKEMDQLEDINEAAADSNGDDPSSWDSKDVSNLQADKTDKTDKDRNDYEANDGSEGKPRHEKTHERFSIFRIVIWSLSIVVSIVGVWQNFGSNFYWFFLGKNISAFCTKVFILVDYLIASNLIIPTDPWFRYRYGPMFRPEP